LRRLRQQHVKQSLLGGLSGATLDGGTLFVFDQLDRHLGQIAHHRVNIATDVADLGELAGLDLDERRSDELGKPPGDLGLADAGRADEDDVLGRDLVAELAIDLLPSPAVAQGDRDGTLGITLTDDVAIEFLDDGARGEVFGLATVAHSSSSQHSWVLV
jgi:hypothetical protein